MENLFDGLGTELIVLAIGLLTGGTVGYRIGIRKSKIMCNNQSAKAGEKSSQTMIGNITNIGKNNGR